jgi:glycosyltransferase involved in cell wall biosynthesis
MFECFKNQTYPKSRMEWIIVDDGTDKIKDLVESSKIPQIKYFEINKKMSLGEKRNFMHTHATGSIIVYMDDDDYYPPERVSHAVDKLTENKEALCAGSSEIYIYYKHIHKMYQCGPYGPNHATAGTFAFRSELLKQTKYDDNAAIAEEKSFLKNYTIPFVQLDPMKTILVFSHNHNTFDKRRLLQDANPQFCKESPKRVEDFISQSFENNIKKFFMHDIDDLLEKYLPGAPAMKPDVLEQIKKIDKEREEMLQKMNNQPQQQIMMTRPGMEPVAISLHDAVNIIQQQQQQIQIFTDKIREQETIIQKLQKQLIEKTAKCDTIHKPVKMEPSTTKSITIEERSKSEPEIKLKLKD